MQPIGLRHRQIRKFLLLLLLLLLKFADAAQHLPTTTYRCLLPINLSRQPRREHTGTPPAARVQRRRATDPSLRQMVARPAGPAEEAPTQRHGSLQVPSVRAWIREGRKREAAFPALCGPERQPGLRFLD